MAVIAVVVREVIERVVKVEVPDDFVQEDVFLDKQPAGWAAEAAVRRFKYDDDDFYRLIPGQNIDDQSPWAFGDLDYEGASVEAYDFVSDPEEYPADIRVTNATDLDAVEYEVVGES